MPHTEIRFPAGDFRNAPAPVSIPHTYRLARCEGPHRRESGLPPDTRPGIHEDAAFPIATTPRLPKGEKLPIRLFVLRCSMLLGTQSNSPKSNIG